MEKALRRIPVYTVIAAHLLLTLIFVGNLQKCSRYVSSQPVAKFRFVLSSGSLRYSMHVKPIFVLVETSKVTWERELFLYTNKVHTTADLDAQGPAHRLSQVIGWDC